MKNKTLKIALIILAFILGATITALLMQTPAEKTPVELPETFKEKLIDRADEIPSSTLKDAFMGGCMEEGADRSYCLCAYNYLMKEMGQEKFIEASFKYYETDVMSPEFENTMVDAVYYCLD